ncbi:MAG: hypothetical protein ACOCV9_06030 [Marinilabiliaceae bacterium]
MPLETTYIKNENINRIRYDNTLKRSFNANVLAYSWYLDLVCDDWDLLVEGDYETVCPLPLRKKAGITTVHQPGCAPFLGIFSSHHLPLEKVRQFLASIPHKHVHLTLNYHNQLSEDQRRGIYRIPVVDLIPPYEKTKERYHTNGREVIDKEDGIFVMRSIRTDEYMAFRRRQKKGSIVRNMQLTRIINYAIRYKSAGIYSVYSPRNELIGAAFLMKANNRVFLGDWVENREGRKAHAIFRAVDHIIRHNSEINLTLELPYGCRPVEKMIRFDHHHCPKFRKGFL